MADRERNRFSARAARYANVGSSMGGVAAKFAASRLFGVALNRGKNASELAAALGGLKGPIMKVAQLMATIPDLLPPEYVEELQKLQSEAPPMGWPFVKRRMTAAGLALATAMEPGHACDHSWWRAWTAANAGV